MNKFISIICVLACIGLVAFANATDYCDSDLCTDGKTNIGCDNDGKFDSDCPSDAAMVDIDDSLQTLILENHNEYRNTVAGGDVEHLDAACRMATMQWDDELADLAALNVKQCVMKHDECHNTDTFMYSGQNLGAMPYSDEANSTALIKQAISLWYDENEDTKMEYIKSYPKNYDGPQIGHFTVMVADRNIRVGCAAATYTESGKDHGTYLFACNYATTNMKGYAIYESCSKAAEDCSSGTNDSYSNLCSKSEEYKVNEW